MSLGECTFCSCISYMTYLGFGILMMLELWKFPRYSSSPTFESYEQSELNMKL